MAAFILVHGTFARAAHWPALQDGLALAACAAGEHSRFDELTWSGKNRASARQTAASEISLAVQNIQSTSRNEKIFIIGHSHGGSAIAYFLKEYSNLAKTLSGCAFLSTPFVAIRPRTQAIHVVSVAFFFPLIAVYALWNYVMYSLKHSGRLDVYIDPIYYFGIGLLAVLSLLVLFTLRKFRNSEKLLQEAHRRQTVDIPPGNYLFLRYSGDEAAAALSAAQFIAWLSMKLSRPLELLIRPVFSSCKTVRIVYATFISSIISVATLESLRFGDQVLLGVRDLPMSVAEGQFALSFILIAFFLFVIVVPYLFVLCTLAAFLIFLMQALTSWAFGWTELFTGFFVELAIEPLPFGAHSMTHIDWSVDSLGFEGVTHGWTYAHPVAIRYVQDWVKTALQCRQT